MRRGRVRTTRRYCRLFLIFALAVSPQVELIRQDDQDLVFEEHLQVSGSNQTEKGVVVGVLLVGYGIAQTAYGIYNQVNELRSIYQTRANNKEALDMVGKYRSIHAKLCQNIQGFRDRLFEHASKEFAEIGEDMKCPSELAQNKLAELLASAEGSPFGPKRDILKRFADICSSDFKSRALARVAMEHAQWTGVLQGLGCSFKPGFGAENILNMVHSRQSLAQVTSVADREAESRRLKGPLEMISTGLMVVITYEKLVDFLQRHETKTAESVYKEFALMQVERLQKTACGLLELARQSAVAALNLQRATFTLETQAAFGEGEEKQFVGGPKSDVPYWGSTPITDQECVCVKEQQNGLKILPAPCLISIPDIIKDGKDMYLISERQTKPQALKQALQSLWSSATEGKYAQHACKVGEYAEY